MRESLRRAPRHAFARALLAVSSVLALASVAPLAARAGEVRGQLTVPTDYASAVPRQTDAERARARYWEEWNGFLDPRGERIDVARDISVVLTGSGPLAEHAPPYEIRNGSLMPSTLVVRAGTQIRLVNRDAISYEIYAEGNDEVAPTQTAAEATRPISVSAPGNWPLRDRIYGHVRGHLHALPDLVAVATLGADGHFTFHDVPAGTYRLHAFHGAREIITAQEVVVTDAPLTIPAVAVTATATP